MVLLEQFKLIELKEIFKKIRNKYNILEDYKLYFLNKYDILTILRNTKYFDENHDTYLYFKIKDNKKIRFKPERLNRLFKGLKIKNGIKFEIKPITLNFD